MMSFIKSSALWLGFDACGIAQADELTEDAMFLKSWLEKGMQGELGYMERNFEKRTDPRKLVPGCKSVVVVLMNS
jgi:epoxyqueuosine reductase